MTWKISLLTFCIGCLAALPLAALDIQSIYTKFDFERDCVAITAPETDEGVEIGGTYRCSGYQDYPIIFKVGDLRESAQFGHLDPLLIERSWESFGPWNSVNDVFEWRLHDGLPVAVIHRVFLDNIDTATGEVTPRRRGQVLVVSRVADKGRGLRAACAVALIDARANADANLLARKVADDIDRETICSNESPPFHGKVGPYVHPMQRSFP